MRIGLEAEQETGLKGRVGRQEASRESLYEKAALQSWERGAPAGGLTGWTVAQLSGPSAGLAPSSVPPCLGQVALHLSPG